MNLKLFFTILFVSHLSLPLFATDIVSTKRLNFENYNNEDRVVGVIKEYDTKSYKFIAKKNQTLRVILDSDVIHFNVYSPNKSTVDGAIFDGSSQGKVFNKKLKKSGIYTVQVYLSDEEAEKGTKIIFTMDIGLE